jgi:RNA polymerase sigma-70 factor (ECF subfamily)
MRNIYNAELNRSTLSVSQSGVVWWANVDTVPEQPVNAAESLPSAQPVSVAPELIPTSVLDELWRMAACAEVGLRASEFRDALLSTGSKCNYGLDLEAEASAGQRQAFWQALHLTDLALAQACALGREGAWQLFMSKFREPLMRAAVSLTRSASLGEELAEALYSELFGLTERDGERWSPLSTYSGRGSLLGWLRAMLAQRQVNHFRRTHRETALEDLEIAAKQDSPEPEDGTLKALQSAVESTLAQLDAEDRFLLSAYYLDSHTLLELGSVLRVHEATVSRRLKRVTDQVHKKILKALQAQGLSRRAAEETLGTDPRDVDVNLRKLLQTPPQAAFSNMEGHS